MRGAPLQGALVNVRRNSEPRRTGEVAAQESGELRRGEPGKERRLKALVSVGSLCGAPKKVEVDLKVSTR